MSKENLIKLKQSSGLTSKNNDLYLSPISNFPSVDINPYLPNTLKFKIGVYETLKMFHCNLK